LSYNKESAYGTAVLDANIGRLFDLVEPGLAEVAIEMLSDDALIKGHEFPNDINYNIQVARDVTIPFSFHASPELAGALMALALGTYSASGAGPYVHTITALDGTSSDQLPSTSLVQVVQGDTATYKKYKGACVNEFKLSVQNRGRVGMSGSFFTDGSAADAAAFSIPSSKEPVTPLHGTGATFGTANSGSGVVDASASLRSWDFTWNNNLDRADNRGQVAAGINLTTLRFGGRSMSMVVKVQGNKGDAYWTDWQANTLKNVEVQCVSGSYSIKIAIPRCLITNVKDSFDGIRNVNEVTYKPFATTTTSKTPITVTVTSQVAAYLL